MGESILTGIGLGSDVLPSLTSQTHSGELCTQAVSQHTVYSVVRSCCHMIDAVQVAKTVLKIATENQNIFSTTGVAKKHFDYTYLLGSVHIVQQVFQECII